MASAPLDRVGLAFARQFYEAIVNDTQDPFTMLDEETVYSSGEGEAVASQRSVVGRGKINLDLELKVFRGKQLKLTFVDTQQTFDEGLLVLVSGAAIESSASTLSAREFVQTFLLGKDPVEGGFFIRNTVLRFLAPSAVVTPVTSTSSAAPTATSAASAPVSAPTHSTPATTAASSASAPNTTQSAKGKRNNSNNPTTAAAATTTNTTNTTGGKGKKDDAKSTAATAGPVAAAAVAPSAAAPSSGSASAPVQTKESTPKTAPTQPAQPKTPASFLDAARRQPAPASKQPEKRSAPPAVSAAAATATSPATPANGSSGATAPKADKRSKGAANGADGSASKGSKADKHAHINPNAQCYVSNIAFGSSNADLQGLLSRFGPIKNIIRPANKGYGFVEFESDEDARKAIDNAAGVNLTLDSRELKIELRTGQGTGTPAPTKNEKRGPRRDREPRESGGRAKAAPKK